jgi:hypothetical protein
MSAKNDLPAISKEGLAAFRAAAPAIVRETAAQALSYTADVAQHGEQAASIITAGLEFTIRMLDSAMAVGATLLLEDELVWAKVRLPHDGVSMQQVAKRLKLMRQICLAKLPSSYGSEVVRYIDWMAERLETIV